ncbi:hypothetical protein BCR42DRAFT_449479 [Absidia repens]|uniref:F-box domain-containing protein n=1 Tax=Absidia repens TaxID=90262 RepID=A0A1X2IP34_9FUNG|nr:hypothetical protein BCR42DRAFT_449479 [Absidia repens]
MQHVSQLEFLEITNGPHITDTSFEYLPQQCPHLMYLSLHKSPITLQTIVALGEHCPQVGTISLERCTNLGYDIFSALATWPSLEDLAISLCDLNGMGDTLVTEETALDLIACKGLKRLFIQEIRWTFRDALPPPTVIAFIQSHPHLEELELTGGTLTDATLNAITMHLPGITKVGMSGNRQITSRAVRRLVQNCHELGFVALDGCGIPADDFPELGEVYLEFDDDGNDFVLCLDGNAPDKIRNSRF